MKIHRKQQATCRLTSIQPGTRTHAHTIDQSPHAHEHEHHESAYVMQPPLHVHLQ